MHSRHTSRQPGRLRAVCVWGGVGVDMQARPRRCLHMYTCIRVVSCLVLQVPHRPWLRRLLVHGLPVAGRRVLVQKLLG